MAGSAGLVRAGAHVVAVHEDDVGGVQLAQVVEVVEVVLAGGRTGTRTGDGCRRSGDGERYAAEAEAGFQGLDARGRFASPLRRVIR
jgi:hypothetical protein